MTTLLAIGGLSPLIGSNVSGPVTLPSTSLGIVLTTTQGLLWLHLGAPVCTLALEVSHNGGTTWFSPTTDAYADVYIPAGKGRAANTMITAASVDEEIGGIPRQFRVTWNFTALVTMDVKLGSLEP